MHASLAYGMRSNAMPSPRRAARFSALLGSEPPPSVRLLQVSPRLLVRDGLHAGAWLTLRGSSMRLGRGDDCDIVLTDADVPEHAGAFVSTPRGWHFRRAVATTVADAPGAAQQDEGADVAVAAPPAHGPIVAPESQTRHARFRRRRWQLHGVTLVVIDIATLPEPPSAQTVARVKILALGAGATVLVAGTLLVLAFMVVPGLETKLVQARESLTAAGFREVTARREGHRQLVLGGFVADSAELARLKTWTQGVNHFEVKLQVKSGQELASRVRDAIGATGDAAGVSVNYHGQGRVRVEGSTGSGEVKRRVQALVGEMKGAAIVEDRVALVEMRELQKARPMPVRIASATGGATPYFVSDTGVVYTLGSRLPDGAEVTAIAPPVIVFQRDGQPITYRLDAEPTPKP
jgi:hypothetical protein